MKKIFIASALCLTAASMSAAQWHEDPSKSNLLISGLDETGACLIQAKETVDGKFWITWLSWQNGMNGYIKAQLLDKEGNALLEEGGITVVNQPTAAWTSNYGMNVTPDGCLVVCHSDSRNDSERHEFTPHAYKIDQEGNQLWGLGGVEIPTLDHAGHRPMVGVTNEGTVIIGFNDIDNANNCAFTMHKFNEDGTFAWANGLTVGGMFGAFSPCDEDDLYLSLINGGGIQLYRIDSLGDLVWEEPVIVEDRDPNTRSEVVPVPDEIGGVMIPYQRYINLSVCYAGMQRINPDGETCMGMRGIDLSELPAKHSVPAFSLNGKREEMIVAWNVSEADYNNIYVMKYDYSGVPQWDEPIKVKEDRMMWGYPTVHAKMLDDGSAFICYDDTQGAVSSVLRLMKINNNGDILWDKAMSPKAYRDEPILFFDEEKGEGYIFSTDNRKDNGTSPGGGIYGQNFKLVDESEVSVEGISGAPTTVAYAEGLITVTGESEGTAELYDVAGAKVASFAVEAGTTTYAPEVNTGLYIVRVQTAAGTVSKKVNIF